MPAREDCLKRVSSEPSLCIQEKGVLLKRKLSLLDQDVIVNEDGRNKLKRQGGKNFTTLTENTLIYSEWLPNFFLKNMTPSLCFNRNSHWSLYVLINLWWCPRRINRCLRFWVFSLHEVSLSNFMRWIFYINVNK